MLFDIQESGYDAEAQCWFALATMFNGDKCRVRCNGFEPGSRTIEHQSPIDTDTACQVCDGVTKEIYRLHINPALRKSRTRK